MIDLTHLYGPLNLVIPWGFSWLFWDNEYEYGTFLAFNTETSISDDKVSFSVYRTGEIYEHIYSFNDLDRVGDVAFFDAEGVRGRLEFAYGGIWFTVYEDENGVLDNGTVFYDADYMSPGKG